MENDQSMNNERVKQLINAYGANPENWPLDEGDSALKLLMNSSELQDLQQSQFALDEMINTDKETLAYTPAHAEQMTNKVSKSVATKMIAKEQAKPNWFATVLQGLTLPRFALALSLLLVSVVIINQLPTSQPQQQLAQAEFDRWMLSQTTTVYNEDEPVTELGFIELVELELDTESDI